MLQKFTAAVLFLSLAACEETPSGFAADRVGPRAPAGTVTIEEAVDGLIVGHRLMAGGEFELALSAYTRAIETQGLSSDVLSAIGSANLRLGRLNQAKKFLQTAVDRDPEFVPAWNNLGVVQLNQNNFIDARASFQRAFALDNGNSEEIRTNLLLAIELTNTNSAEIPEDADFVLVRRGNGRYLLLGQ